MWNATHFMRRWLRLDATPKSKTMPPVNSARAQLNRIEWKLDRLGWHWTKHVLSLSTSGPTGQTSNTGTDTTITGPTASPVHRTMLKKIGGWLLEKVISWALHILAPLALSAWAMGRERLASLWQWAGEWWHWLMG